MFVEGESEACFEIDTSFVIRKISYHELTASNLGKNTITYLHFEVLPINADGLRPAIRFDGWFDAKIVHRLQFFAEGHRHKRPPRNHAGRGFQSLPPLHLKRIT